MNVLDEKSVSYDSSWGGKNICAEVHGNPSDSCWDILLQM